MLKVLEIKNQKSRINKSLIMFHRERNSPIDALGKKYREPSYKCKFANSKKVGKNRNKFYMYISSTVCQQVCQQLVTPLHMQSCQLEFTNKFANFKLSCEAAFRDLCAQAFYIHVKLFQYYSQLPHS